MTLGGKWQAGQRKHGTVATFAVGNLLVKLERTEHRPQTCSLRLPSPSSYHFIFKIRGAPGRVRAEPVFADSSFWKLTLSRKISSGLPSPADARGSGSEPEIMSHGNSGHFRSLAKAPAAIISPAPGDTAS